MDSRLKPIKKIFFGGSNSYYIDKDRNYFIKINKGKREWIIKEYQYLKKYWDKIGIENLQLVEILRPNVYYDFGKKMKLFHDKGFSHSHLEVHDVLYSNGKFYLADVPFFNEREQIHDLVSMKLSLNMYKLKRPWNWYKYKICSKEFFKAYKLFNSEELHKEYIISINKRIRLYLRRGQLFKFKAYMLKLIYKCGLL